MLHAALSALVQFCLSQVFIALGSVTAVLFFLSILADFALRHRGRVPARVRSKERIATGFAVIFSLLTAIFCILLVCRLPAALSACMFQVLYSCCMHARSWCRCDSQPGTLSCTG